MKNIKIYNRLLDIDESGDSSLFLFGPRGTGKTLWLRGRFPDALWFDLLDTDVYTDFIARPSRLAERIPAGFEGPIIIDEVQKIPELLNEVHRLIELHRYQFILTGSSSRSLKRKGVNLLGGRALNYTMHPLTCLELGEDFSLETALQFGTLPSVYQFSNPAHYLETYISSYLREEVLQEGLARNLGQFARFLEIASFSQGSLLNYSEVARDAGIDRKVAGHYFEILEDLLIACYLPVFTKRAKRRLVSHSKFYLFDPGVYRILRPKGPLDVPEEMEGACLETLFLLHLRAFNDYFRLGYQLYFWRTGNQTEVDFVAYGEKGLLAFEIKRGRSINRFDLTGLRAFSSDYPMAKCYLLYGGDHEEFHDGIHVLPFESGLKQLADIMGRVG